MLVTDTNYIKKLILQEDGLQVETITPVTQQMVVGNTSYGKLLLADKGNEKHFGSLAIQKTSNEFAGKTTVIIDTGKELLTYTVNPSNQPLFIENIVVEQIAVSAAGTLDNADCAIISFTGFKLTV